MTKDGNLEKDGASAFLLIRLKLVRSAIKHHARRLLTRLDHWLSSLSSWERIEFYLLLPSIVWLLIRGISPRWLAADLSGTVIGMLVALAVLRWAFSRGPRQKVVAVAVFYVAIMLLFGMIYHVLFHIAPEDSFVFADSIREGKAHQVFMGHYKEVLRLNDSLYLLSIMDSRPQRSFEIRKHAHVFDPGSLNSDDSLEQLTNECSVRFMLISSATLPIANGVAIDLRGQGKRVFIGGPNSASGPSDIDFHTLAVKRVFAAETVEDFIAAERGLQVEIVQLRDEAISALRANVNKQTDWDYLDFCYFSAMTMTTVGYGDILPSSRLSRAFVLFHAVLSIFYIGFALSILWPTSTSDAKPSHNG
jgi:Ion channel